MGLGECFCTASASFCALCFIFLTLQMLGEYEQRKYFINHTQVIMLSGIVISAGGMLYTASPANFFPGMCSMAVMFTVAAVDELTGYVYDCFNFYFVAVCGMLALSQGTLKVIRQNLFFLIVFMLALTLMAVLHGLGAGDVPVYLALMLYYMRYTAFPAGAAISMFMLSQLLFMVSAFIQRKRHMPLVPYICAAHFMTLCLWKP